MRLAVLSALNIEATYAAITGQFAEYPNLCFVDTLDNVAALSRLRPNFRFPTLADFPPSTHCGHSLKTRRALH